MVVDKTLYNILGVESNATNEVILKAIKKKSLEHHPDRGGSHEMMQQVNAAKAVLTDSELREKYDRYGLQGMQSGMDAGNGQFGGLSGGLFDLFDLLSRRAASQHGKSRMPTGTDIEVVLKISLEELYSGSMKTIEIDRCIVCLNCQGTGHRDRIDRQCKKCQGKGIVTSVNQTGETIRQTQCQCSVCHGDGNNIDWQNRCESCHAQKLIREKKMIDVHIPCGSENGKKIKFINQGNGILHGEPGTLWVILEQKPHSIFNRNGDHLTMNSQINLSESLCGFQYPITLPDGRTILLDHPSGKPILPNSYRCIKGYGMPNRQTHVCGDLIIHFDVKFPSEGFLTSEQQRVQLEANLPSKSSIEISNKKRCYEKVDMIHCDQPQEYSSNADDDHSDDDNVRTHNGRQGRPCQMQ